MKARKKRSEKREGKEKSRVVGKAGCGGGVEEDEEA